MSNLPLAPGTWELDAAHSAVTFKVRHLGLSNVRGRFRSFAVVLDVGATLAETKINATIDVTSIDTNQADRDAHLLSTDFFAADANPSIEFTSTAISRTGDQYSVAGGPDHQRHHAAGNARCRVHGRRDRSSRRPAACRLPRQHRRCSRRLRDRLQHATRLRPGRDRPEDRGRDRLGVHPPLGHEHPMKRWTTSTRPAWALEPGRLRRPVSLRMAPHAGVQWEFASDEVPWAVMSAPSASNPSACPPRCGPWWTPR
jgi:hypothetical protein